MGARLERLAASPGTISRIMDLIGEFDVGAMLLPSIRRAHARDAPARRHLHQHRGSRYIAVDPGARYVELFAGSDNMFSVGDSDALLGEIEEHLTGVRHDPETDRMLATVMFTDICDSTRRAAEMGDRGCGPAPRRNFRQALERHRGREVKRTGDGPARASAARRRWPRRWVVGQCSAPVSIPAQLEVMDGDLGGLAVHIAARVLDQASPSEVLVSGTVKDLVVGSESVSRSGASTSCAACLAGPPAPLRRLVLGRDRYLGPLDALGNRAPNCPAHCSIFSPRR